MTETDWPEPDPAKLSSQLSDWVDGDELPGRTMAYLKTGRVEMLLETNSASLFEIWSRWENGDSLPEPALKELTAAGLPSFLSDLASESPAVSSDQD